MSIDIRAQAIQRLARADYARWHHAYGKNSDYLEWDEAEALCKAQLVIDDLGDFLPDAYIESRGGMNVENFQGEIVRRIPLEERYMTEWRVVDR